MSRTDAWLARTLLLAVRRVQDPSDPTYLVDYAYLLRTGTDTRVVPDRHVEGLFSVSTWLDAFHAAGFDARPQPYRHSEVERPIDVFVARRS